MVVLLLLFFLRGVLGRGVRLNRRMGLSLSRRVSLCGLAGGRVGLGVRCFNMSLRVGFSRLGSRWMGFNRVALVFFSMSRWMSFNMSRLCMNLSGL